MKKAFAVVALTSCIAAICRTASPGPLPEKLLACGKLQDPGERVHCYDAQIAAINGPAGAAPTPTTTAPVATPTPLVTAAPTATASAAPPKAAAPPPPTPQPTIQFGKEQLPHPSTATASPQDDALLASITSVRTVGQKTLVSLSNGQIWRQEGSQLTALSRVGDNVRIEKGALGAYHMSIVAYGAKNWVLVTRVM